MKRLEDRLIENEVIFRQFNESVEKGLRNLKKIAVEQDWYKDVKIDDSALYFYCECSDENCQQRILIRPSRYRRIHADRRRFIVVIGHQIPMLEEVIDTNGNYCVIRKYDTPPESADGLHRTPINNT